MIESFENNQNESYDSDSPLTTIDDSTSFSSERSIHTEDIKKKKRKKHFFEHHINKILKEVCPDRDITYQAKKQLNELAIITCKLIVDKIFTILSYSEKKTITETEIESAVKLVFNGQLGQKSIEEGKKCLDIFHTNSKSIDLKGQQRHVKAEILVPPSILESFLRTKGHHISSTSSIFLAGIIEYFLAQILDIANNIYLARAYRRKSSPIGLVKIKTGVRISLFDIEAGVKSDKELNTFFTSNNIFFNGSGITPFIHPSLLIRTGENDKKSLKMIAKIQSDNEMVFTKSTIENKFRNYISLIYPEMRYQKNCFNLLQDYIEKWIIELLKNANNITLYSGKSRVSSNEIELVMSILEKRIPEFLESEPYSTTDFLLFPSE
jgi:histone H3/H4